MATKKTSKKAAKKKTTAKKVTKSKSKFEKAVMIVDKMFQSYCDEKVSRKDILARLMKECDMSKAYASTAFQSIKTKILNDEL